MNDLNKTFVDVWAALEDWAKNVIHCENAYSLVHSDKNNNNRPPLSPLYKDRIDTFRNLRNFLIHTDNNGRKLITVHQELIDMEKELLNGIMNSVLTVAIPVDKIFYCTKEDNVMYAINKMGEKNYTHIPIVVFDKDKDENKMKVIGVFSENTLLKMVALEGEVSIKTETTFDNIWEYISKPNEKNKIFGFISSKKSYADCVIRFNNKMEDNERLDILFITEDGTPDTELQGLISTWDVSSRGL